MSHTNKLASPTGIDILGGDLESAFYTVVSNFITTLFPWILSILHIITRGTLTMLGGSNGFNKVFHMTWIVILFFL